MQLPDEQAQAFHHAVAQLIFLGMLACPDLIMLVYFLTRCVREPDEDDWSKLKRGINYLHATRHVNFLIIIASVHTIHWYVDVSYGVHTDCKGHTGMIMTMVLEAMMSMFMEQKINTRSSTESEMGGIDDALGDILWDKYFIEAQGYTINHNVIHQDNKSTIHNLTVEIDYTP